ncbi:hypothetical protein A0M39_01880 [Campylobacter jejuni]|nr:hypothetical protein [Campylobacter jejuni]OEW43271.1 hypothetical protein AJ884_01580 [Campylobacter sp. BCW_6463]PCH29204.1 hypothetical protein BGS46_07460 [Campylobacter sp. 113]PCM57576.1 hypothetical protein CP502_02615 [Campylobacter sp. BCW_8712]OEV60189.1 hypothetical protein AJY69_00190 [Campylobacter jejuni]
MINKANEKPTTKKQADITSCILFPLCATFVFNLKQFAINFFKLLVLLYSYFIYMSSIKINILTIYFYDTISKNIKKRS